MTSEELAAFRELVVAELEKHKIAVAHPPVCIITATDLESRRDSRGRRYPWGNALSERPGSPHAELPALRRFLLIDGLASLKAASREHYESFRRQALWRSHVGVKPLARTLLPPARVRLAPQLGAVLERHASTLSWVGAGAARAHRAAADPPLAAPPPRARAPLPSTRRPRRRRRPRPAAAPSARQGRPAASPAKDAAAAAAPPLSGRRTPRPFVCLCVRHVEPRRAARAPLVRRARGMRAMSGGRGRGSCSRVCVVALLLP